MNPKAYRLPTQVLPARYDIDLDARLGSSSFKGHVAIQLRFAEPTSTIELHARGLRIASATVTSERGVAQAAVALDAERELAIFHLDEPIAAASATLDIPFTADISSGLEGLFLSKDGPQELLVTQCEATGARAIFPCFDEPLFKARFAWRVTTDAGATVLTNGKLLSDETAADGASHTCTFEATAPMSTYLVALAIGDLTSTPERIVNGVPLGIWGLRGTEALGMFALDYTARLLPFYEDYFAAPYHFGKLDQVGVPSFGAGAMENAGLIVSQGVLLHLDEKQASVQQRLIAAMVIAHEFAHMWFGDLVTMRWWDDLWLNEAFASWMASHAVDALTPEYRIWDELQQGSDAALETDGLASTHPIYNQVETPASINENFDNITYQKGGAVLRMIHDFLGDEAFRAGLRTYMREFAEGNAAGADLWRHLQAAAQLPVGQVMESWILQAGHPIVDVSLETGVDGTQLRLSQQRFFSSAGAQPSDQLWQVPMVIRYEDGAGTHELRYLLTERSATLRLAVSGELVWCYPNANEVGFYRLHLDETLARLAGAQLDSLTVAERKGLLRDSWAAVANATQPIARHLDLLAALSSTTDHTLMGQIVQDHLPRVWDLLYNAHDEAAMTAFRAWVARLFTGRLATLGYEAAPGENTDVALLRAAVIAAMTRYAEDAAAIEQARQWQAREAADPDSVDANVAGVFVGVTAQFGDASTYDRYLSIYDARKSGAFTPQQLDRYANAFARFQQPELVARTLRLLDDGTFSLQMFAQIVGQYLFQRKTQQAAWEFVKSHWAYIAERAPFWTPRLVQASGELPKALRGDVVAFWTSALNGEFAGPLARALENIDQIADLQARTRADLLAYFAPATPTTPSTPSTTRDTAARPTSADGDAPPAMHTASTEEASPEREAARADDSPAEAMPTAQDTTGVEEAALTDVPPVGNAVSADALTGDEHSLRAEDAPVAAPAADVAASNALPGATPSAASALTNEAPASVAPPAPDGAMRPPSPDVGVRRSWLSRLFGR